MTSPVRPEASRSLRLYARLLELYPPSFLQQHRAEMLQNFADFEDAAGSKAGLWLFIGNDLVLSLGSNVFHSRLGKFVIGVLVAWTLLFALGYFFVGSTPGYPALHFFGGFLPGLLVMYITARLYRTPQNKRSHFFRSRFDLSAIGVFAGWWLALVAAGHVFSGSGPGHAALQVFGGCLIGMIAMYIATHVYGTS